MMESFRLERKQLRLDNYKQRKIITKLQRESKRMSVKNFMQSLIYRYSYLALLTLTIIYL